MTKEKIGKCHDCTVPQTEVNILSRHILELQADKGRLIDKVKELEAEVKEWKDKADLWCKTANLKDHNIMINKELEKENAELKKKCYKKAVKDYCELEKENAELKEMIQEMYFLLRNYDKFFLGDRLLKCFEKVENYNFLKDSEVEK